MTETGRRRVAVLGGGPAALAAAFALTEPAVADGYEVTLYQPGWRLGGKCASGRNMSRGGRIEEHGLHVWFGFYDNSFALMRRVYAELAHPAGHPLSSVERAFIGCDDLVMCDTDADGVHEFCVRFPRNELVPGDAHPLPDFWQIALSLCGWAMRHHLALGSRGSRRRAPGAVEALLARAARLAASRRSGAGGAERFFTGLLCRARDLLWERSVSRRCEHDARLRLFFTTFDTFVSLLAGIVADGVLERGWDVVNDRDLCEWLVAHGAKQVTVGASPAERAPLLRAIYDLAFAYPGGEIAAANAAAGTAGSNLLRLLFSYRGAILYKMRAGMGDTVIAPLYEVLRRRGVRFEFFHAVTSIRPSAETAAIDSVEIVPQARLRGAEYEPLVDVGEISCWPSEPLWAQLDEAAPPPGGAAAFEQEANPLGREPRVLRRGADFDDVVLGIPVSSLPEICAPLCRRDPRFSAMVGSATTVATQSFQLWLTAPASRLGWPHGANTVAETPDRELSTWCDMGYLLDSEQHDPSAGVRGLAYFCGVLSDSAGLGAEDVAENARRFIEVHLGELWPQARAGGEERGVRWTLLADGERGAGSRRLLSQYLRANTSAGDRYVLTPAGSVELRLAPGESGFSNLVLAGDWTRTGIDGGCVEAAITAGLQAARALIGHSHPIAGESTTWLTDGAGAGLVGALP